MTSSLLAPISKEYFPLESWYGSGVASAVPAINETTTTNQARTSHQVAPVAFNAINTPSPQSLEQLYVIFLKEVVLYLIVKRAQPLPFAKFRSSTSLGNGPFCFCQSGEHFPREATVLTNKAD
jgi:hypothetical protein